MIMMLCASRATIFVSNKTMDMQRLKGLILNCGLPEVSYHTDADRYSADLN